ncbi:MAG: metal-sensing transcriptional repressor [Clostridia bacterium]|nr:metal-sensing transcriptional repressor [Clostridia bacterium]
MEKICHCKRKKKRSPEETARLLSHLHRIEGQIRGLANMVEEEAYCPDILTQASAARASLASFSRSLLEEHIRTCVCHDLAEGKTEAAEELVQTLRGMMK